jgi:hypothetical protein
LTNHAHRRQLGGTDDPGRLGGEGQGEEYDQGTGERVVQRVHRHHLGGALHRCRIPADDRDPDPEGRQELEQ